MAPSFSSILILSAIFTLYKGRTASSTTMTTLGVTYDPTTRNLPPPEQVVKTLRHLHIQAVRLINPTPPAIRAFSYTKISLLLSVPNPLLPSFAANRSVAALWLHNNVLPFHPRSRISAISVGSDVNSSLYISDPSTTLLRAIRNVHDALEQLGLKTISVSTSFSFVTIMAVWFPPSSAEFLQPIFDTIIKPVLQFLQETNSTFMVNIYPYNNYKLRPWMPLGYVLFKDCPFYFRDDIVTGVRYRNIFDMMVDGVITALAMTGYDNIPVIVTETGWPSSDISGGGNSTLAGEPDATPAYAEIYLDGLILHLKSGMGTPLKKEGLEAVYIYKLFDDDGAVSGVDNITHRPGELWGILYPNLSMKYNIHDFSTSAAGADDTGERARMTSPVVVAVISILMLL